MQPDPNFSWRTLVVLRPLLVNNGPKGLVLGTSGFTQEEGLVERNGEIAEPAESIHDPEGRSGKDQDKRRSKGGVNSH